MPADRAAAIACSIPFSGEMRPAMRADREGADSIAMSATPLGSTRSTFTPAPRQCAWQERDTVASAPVGTCLAASTTPVTMGGRCNVCSTGRPRGSSSAGASNACWLITSTSIARIVWKIRPRAAATPGAGGGCDPPGMTSASAASGGAATVTSFTPSTCEPSAQWSVTSCPRSVSPRARSQMKACAPPSCAGRSAVTGEETTAILITPS